MDWEQSLRFFLLSERIPVNELSLIKQAFMHPSYVNEVCNIEPSLPYKKKPLTTKQLSNNQRLEFIGDAVIALAIKEKLYLSFPQANEGTLSLWSSELVAQKSLARIAKQIKIDKLLLLGKGENKSGGEYKESNLADALEALCAAIYLDQDYGVIKQLLDRWFQVSFTRVCDKSYICKDGKSCLQEYLQKVSQPLPEYRLEYFDEKKSKFIIRVWIAKQPWAQGYGKNRKLAEQMAAQKTLEEIKKAKKKIHEKTNHF